ncbi:unnamed protein product, partial [Ixodes persulcatus]
FLSLNTFIFKDGCCLKGPRLVEVEKTMETQVDINWTPVASSKVTQYTVRAVPLKNYAPHLGGPLEWKYTDASRAELFGLSAGTLYNVSVWAETSDGPSETTSIFAWTQVGEPDRPPPVEVLSRDGPRMVVRVARGTSTKGPITTGVCRIHLHRCASARFAEDNGGHSHALLAVGQSLKASAALEVPKTGKGTLEGEGARQASARHVQGLVVFQQFCGLDQIPAALISKIIYFLSIGNSKVRTTSNFLVQEIRKFENHRIFWSVKFGSSTSIEFCSVISLKVRKGLNFLAKFENAKSFEPSESLDSIIEASIRKKFAASLIHTTKSLTVAHCTLFFFFFFELRTLILTKKAELGWLRRTLRRRNLPNPLEAGPVKRSLEGAHAYTLPNGAAQWMLPDRERRQLLAEIEGMVHLGVHPNVVLFIGACEDQEFLQLVVEHPPRSLRGLLLTSRHSSEGRVCSLEERQLLELAKGVAAGMCHLARHEVHHGQLSTRSITVVDDLVPKISNFGLARYTPLGKKLDFARWLAPESLKTGSHTAKSDVWSYGVLLWEVFTLGGTPYVNLKTAEVAERVTRGLRLSQPKGVRENMYQLMLQCWELDRDERPTFEQLLSSLQEMLCGEIPVKFSHTPGYTYERFDPLADET